MVFVGPETMTGSCTVKVALSAAPDDGGSGPIDPDLDKTQVMDGPLVDPAGGGWPLPMATPPPKVAAKGVHLGKFSAIFLQNFGTFSSKARQMPTRRRTSGSVLSARVSRVAAKSSAAGERTGP